MFKTKKQLMKKIQLLIGAAVLAGGFSACSNSNEEAKQDANALAVYVDSVDQVTPVYTTAYWSDIDNGYKMRVEKAEKNMSAMSADDKAKAEASKAKYELLKTKYELAIKEKEAAAAIPDSRMILRSKLFGEGKIGSDMKFGFVTADNIKDVYEKFVSTVDDNRNDFSREDWDEIKTLYEALDTRKNEVEKDLATKDNLRIAALKVKFAAIKSVKRPVAKADENVKSKD